MASPVHTAIRRHGRSIIAAAAITILAMTPLPARADLGAAARSVPAAELVGEGRMTFLGFRVFDAELYAPSGKFDPSRPFALKLTYLRNFKGAAIADKSMEEIRRQGMADGPALQDWSRQMRAIFPNVAAGQSITGVRTAGGSTVFYRDNTRIGTIKDPNFTRRFFNIWLGNNTKEPALRAKLVGAAS